MRKVQDINDLDYIKAIGKGGFAEVGLYSKKGKQVVVKKIRKRDSCQYHINREVMAGETLCHKNIAKFHGHFEDEQSHYLAFERVKGLDLFKCLQSRNFEPFTEKESKKIFVQLAKAVNYSHNKAVAHLDIKLDNIMIDPKTLKVKLIDFGLCNFITINNFGQFCQKVGSAEYWPAEFFADNTYCGVKVDVWCLGMVLFCLLNASFPYDPNTRGNVVRETGVHPSFVFVWPVSSQARDLVRRMLEVDPEKRIDMEGIFKHPWMKSEFVKFFSKKM